MKLTSSIYKKILIILSSPIILSEFFTSKTGYEYGIGLWQKILLVVKMIRNNRKIPTASDVIEHLIMATKILSIPKVLTGAVVECGTYKGASAANLSLVAALTGRQLEIFDSFKGLPQPKQPDSKHAIIDKKEIHIYSKGSWKGTLSEVKRNIKTFGKISVCNFHPGFFENTLPNFNQKSVFIFLDVDLVESLKVCLKYLWPKLVNGGYLFTHEAHHDKISSLFFDKLWWAKNLKSKPPSLIGTGTGLGLIPEVGGFKSSIGYTVKKPKLREFKKEAQVG